MGQSNFSIRGKVVDEDGAIVPFASAALYTKQDTTLVTGGVSNDEGKFEINASPGNYFLKVTFLSYQDKIISPLTVTNKDIDLGSITLQTGSQVLESVTVEGERNQMTLQLDKRIFQVGKGLSNISGSAADILDNVPSVTVDSDGNISLRGSQNVRILIDGRPSGLTGISVADALRQLQGNLIESVEVITNPSARYDAEGEVGIINIILKKEQKKGINGSISANGGYPDNYGASFNLNFRKKNYNFFTSYGFNYQASPGSGSSTQSFTQADTTFSYQQQNERIRSGTSHNIRAGVDYYFNDKNILTGSFLFRLSNGLNTTSNTYLDFDENEVLTRTVVRNEREEEPEINSEIALSYRREYNRKGKLLTADFKWIENVETENATFDQTDFSIDSTGYQRSTNTENERNALLQLDYIHPFGEKGKMEMGLKSSLRVIDNDFRLEQQDAEDDNWFLLPELTNDLIYTENIYAGYFMVGNEAKRFGWQAGLRGELSDISVSLAQSNDVTYQNYFNLFPGAHLSYQIKPEKTIQLSYSYRLSRPQFRDLMPFSNYSDNRSVRVGNPQLRPEYTHSLEASYLVNWNSGSILSSAYYRHRTGVIERIAIVDSAGFTRTQPVNLATQDAYGLELNVSWNPVKWWKFNSNTNFYRAITEGVFENQLFYSDTYTWTNRSTSRFTFFKTWDFQTGLNYQAPRITTQGKDLSLFFVDIGLSRDLLKGNGSLTLSVRDLFNTRKFRSIIDREDEGYYSESEYQGRVRQFLVTFTYRINSKKESTKSNDVNSEDD